MKKKEAQRAKRIRGVALCLLLLLSALNASAQRLLVLTSARSATQEKARLSLESVEFNWGQILPGARHFQGRQLFQDMRLSPGGHTLFLSTFSPDPGKATARVTLFRSSPFECLPTSLNLSSQGGPAWIGYISPTQKDGLSTLFCLEKPYLGEGENLLKRLSWQPDTPLHSANASIQEQWKLPGTPLAFLPLPPKSQSDNKYLVLCAAPEENGAFLLLLDGTSATPLQRLHLRPPGADTESRPIAMQFSKTGASLFVLLSGASLESPGGASLSWLFSLNATTFDAPPAPLQIPGEGIQNGPSLFPVEAQHCWVATRVPGTDFAYATFLQPAPEDPMRYEIDQQYALVGALNHFHMAVHPSKRDVVVSIENKLEIWPYGQRGETVDRRYSDSIAVLKWEAAGLFLGEGGRVHQVNTEAGVSLQSVQLQSGWVKDFVVLQQKTLPQEDWDGDGLSADEEEALQSYAHDPDSDDDGIHDGIDPDPVQPSAYLKLSSTAPIDFYPGALGRELRALLVEPKHNAKADWRITFPKEKAPWLILHPLSGTGAQPVYMGVDPARLGRAAAAETLMHLSLSAPTQTTPIIGSPNQLVLRVPPSQHAIQRILWILPEKDPPLRQNTSPEGFQMLADRLASAPHLFSHNSINGPYLEDLPPYAVVVLGAKEAASGALSRQDFLNYVAAGGSLLFLGGPIDAAQQSSLNRWLSPLEIQVEAAQNIMGDPLKTPLAAAWPSLPIAQGCRFFGSQDSALVQDAENKGAAVFLARDYGYGRIALLAGPEALQNNAMHNAEATQFSSQLFQWLAGASRKRLDKDGDQLTDSTEDQNGNGSLDPGETNWLHPDTDGDGLPDGMEDRNRNGIVDEGETDPRNPDSDQDGVKDGADTTPCPTYGAPHIAAIEPAQGPAEGGVFVVISGRNFSPDSLFQFGNRKVPWSRVSSPEVAIVRTPSYGWEGNQTVPVRVFTEGGAQQGILPQAFHYTVRSIVEIRLSYDPKRPTQSQVSFQWPQGRQLKRLTVVIDADSPKAIQWGKPTSSVRSATLNVRPLSAKRIRLDLIAQEKRILPPKTTLTIPWKSTPPRKPLALKVVYASAQNRYNGLLDCRLPESALDIP